MQAAQIEAQERVQCVCGETYDDPEYSGFWVQCEACLVWQHGRCVGLGRAPKGRLHRPMCLSALPGVQILISCASGRQLQGPVTMLCLLVPVGMHSWRQEERTGSYGHAGKLCACCNQDAAAGAYFCQRCLRAKAAAEVSTKCGATLIVCPASILHQWQTEIAKHVAEGALRVVVYEGQQQGLPDQQLGARSLAAAAQGSDSDDGRPQRKCKRRPEPKQSRKVQESLSAEMGFAVPTLLAATATYFIAPGSALLGCRPRPALSCADECTSLPDVGQMRLCVALPAVKHSM